MFNLGVVGRPVSKSQTQTTIISQIKHNTFPDELEFAITRQNTETCKF